MRKDKFRIVQITTADGAMAYMPQRKFLGFWVDTYTRSMPLQQARDVISEKRGKIVIKREVYPDNG